MLCLSWVFTTCLLVSSLPPTGAELAPAGSGPWHRPTGRSSAASRALPLSPSLFSLKWRQGGSPVSRASYRPGVSAALTSDVFQAPQECSGISRVHSRALWERQDPPTPQDSFGNEAPSEAGRHTRAVPKYLGMAWEV